MSEPQRDGAPATTGRHLSWHLGVCAWVALVLIGLDSSQPARAVIQSPTITHRAQLVSPSAFADSPIVADGFVKSDERSNDQETIPVELTVQSGDTLIALLGRVGIVMSDAYAAVRALGPVFRVREVRPGWTLSLMLQAQDPPRLATLQSMTFRPSVEREIKVARRSSDDSDSFLATTIPHPLHRITGLSGGTIDNGLFNTASEAGVPHDLLVQAIDLFSFDVDFQRDIRVGDQYELFYDTLNDEDGNFARAGDLMFAKLVLSGKEMRYYRFTPHSGVSDLFSPDGHSIRKALLQTPVDATRISSTFGMRFHPILGYTMMHRGVDFAAPVGTPVRAAGDGVIQVAGDGGSYGNYIRIEHTSRYSTAYAHLTSFARGVTKGARVRQGQVIAYVGATGRATGPHLHYEVLVGGQQVNPRGVRLPAGETLAGDDLRDFKLRLQEIEAMRESHQLGAGSTLAQAPGAATVSPM
jgi:murein DD-endopeptidase MepM/ murein hydrolase activator NlpD